MQNDNWIPDPTGSSRHGVQQLRTYKRPSGGNRRVQRPARPVKEGKLVLRDGQPDGYVVMLVRGAWTIVERNYRDMRELCFLHMTDTFVHETFWTREAAGAAIAMRAK